ncbi:MAG: HAMP domain-containing protein [Treponema sp.]|jgi:adenylate cyclase|nr:HAMP domain-containing protein [Treponema sp.]
MGMVRMQDSLPQKTITQSSQELTSYGLFITSSKLNPEPSLLSKAEHLAKPKSSLLARAEQRRQKQQSDRGLLAKVERGRIYHPFTHAVTAWHMIKAAPPVSATTSPAVSSTSATTPLAASPTNTTKPQTSATTPLAASPTNTTKPQTAKTVQPQKAAEPLRTVKFPIAMKLMAIISIFMLISMGVITALASYLLSDDVRLTAEDNNYSINRRLAVAAENSLSTIHSKALVLLNSLAFIPDQSAETLTYFFGQNPDITGIAVSFNEATLLSAEQLSSNPLFFLNEQKKLDTALLRAWLVAQNETVERAMTGEILTLNAIPVLDTSDAAMFFPWGEDAAIIFFSTKGLIEGDETNQSFLINEMGDVLVHPEPSMVGRNWGNEPFVRTALESETRSLQTVYVDEQNAEYLGAFQHLSIGDVTVITTIPLAMVLRGITAVTWRNIFLTAGILVLSIAFILLFSRTLSKPLTVLTKAAREIENGTYHISIKNKNRDEIGMLSESFISMGHGLENFERFTNKVLAQLAQTGKLVTGGTDKSATIFFSDIRGFTAISEKLKATEVIEFLNDYMQRMVKCVLMTNGIIDKFIGDAVMAHWGAIETSGSPEEDALNCVKAALMMRAALRAFNRGRGTEKKPIIKIGCGINSGNVVAGQIGSEDRMEYTVIGNAVSFADRTETLNKPFGTDIMISEYTWKLCGYYLITEEMPSVTENGKKVRMFAVVNIRDAEDAKEMLKQLAEIPKNDIRLCRQCIGPMGPKTVAELRTLLDIPTPDLSVVNVDEEEKKYKVQQKSNDVTEGV